MKRASVPRSRGPLGSYLAELDRFPLLSAEEEQSLARAYRSKGEKQIAHRLVTANLRFVVRVAKEHRSYGIALSDLIQEGNIGLMAAVERFDPDKGVRLVTYAVWWIRAAIQDFILRSWSLVRIGTTQSQRRLFFSLARINREIERVNANFGHTSAGADSATVAERTNTKQSEVEEMTWRLGSRDASLDAPCWEGESSFHDLLPDHHPLQEQELSLAQEQELLRVRVGEALSRLHRRERHIIEQHVMRASPLSLSEISAELAISVTRSGQLESRARRKLKRELDGLPLEIGWHIEASPPGGRRGRRTRTPARREGPELAHERGLQRPRNKAA